MWLHIVMYVMWEYIWRRHKSTYTLHLPPIQISALADVQMARGSGEREAAGAGSSLVYGCLARRYSNVICLRHTIGDLSTNIYEDIRVEISINIIKSISFHLAVEPRLQYWTLIWYCIELKPEVEVYDTSSHVSEVVWGEGKDHSIHTIPYSLLENMGGENLLKVIGSFQT